MKGDHRLTRIFTDGLNCSTWNNFGCKKQIPPLRYRMEMSGEYRMEMSGEYGMEMGKGYGMEMCGCGRAMGWSKSVCIRANLWSPFIGVLGANRC